MLFFFKQFYTQLSQSMSITKSLKLGFTIVAIADIYPCFLKKIQSRLLKKAAGYGRVTYKIGG